MAVQNGGPGPDNIDFRPLGLSNDKSFGAGGSDVILGGRGYDSLSGGDGNDVLRGDQDDDKLYGGSGDDDLRGGSGNDRLFGDAGDDLLRGDAGDDYLNGGSGDDDLQGGRGEDRLFGLSGKDNLKGGRDDDILNGGLDRDVLDGSLGRDILTGGPEFAVRDDFVIELGRSNSTNAEVDTVLDWTNVDRIVSDIAGTAANYGEHAAAGGAVIVTDIETARADAEAAHTNKTHMFFYDAGTDTGYLVSDLNNDNLFETGVVLNGAGAAGDFDWTNIIA